MSASPSGTPYDLAATGAPAARLLRRLRENGLSLVLLGLFLLSLIGQVTFGFLAHNEERSQWGEHALGISEYLGSGHFVEALFENWESEFLQMGLFVWLSARLVQKGSTESKELDERSDSDEDPREHPDAPGAPWPVRRGGWLLWLYERSLFITYSALFAISFGLHAFGGLRLENEERVAHGLPPERLLEFMASSQFWFESLQNWQSEFVAILSIVVFTIFLRQRGSPQSKAISAPHAKTGH